MHKKRGAILGNSDALTIRIQNLFERTLEWAEAIVDEAEKNPATVNPNLVMEILKFTGKKLLPDARNDVTDSNEPVEITVVTKQVNK